MLEIQFIFIARVRRSTVDKCDRDASNCMRLRLVVEDTEQRRRIVSITHEDGHFGVKRTYDTIASKYYWPGLFMDVKQHVILLLLAL